MEREYLSANDLETLTGTKSSTFRYWATLDPPQGPSLVSG